MSKGFSQNNPLDKLSGVTQTKKETQAHNEEPKEAVESKEQPKPEAPKQEKKKPDYFRLDLTDYKEYISLMAEYTSNTTGKYVSMTQYILRLIEADKQKNIETYEKLEQIERMKRELM